MKNSGEARTLEIVRRKERVVWPLGLVVCLCLVTFHPAPLLAGRLIIDVFAQAKPVQDRLLVDLTVTNRGGEPALDVQAEAPDSLEPIKSGLIQQLDPGASARLRLSMPRTEDQTGRYAVVSLVNFHDINQHPFSALAQATYYVSQDQRSPLVVEPPSVTMAERRQIKLNLINPEKEPLVVKAKVFAPKELSAGEIQGLLTIEPRQSLEVTFDLWNLAGRAASTYPVMVLLEYEFEGRRTAQVIKVMVSLVQRKNVFRRNLGWWLTGIGLALAALVLAQVRFRRQT